MLSTGCRVSTAKNLARKLIGVLSVFQLLEFNQSEFFGGVPDMVSMDTIGYVYVPTACQNGSGNKPWG